jgi:Asp-tRNA(Asn)/Glu-tRNA(Gln) amidotransferase A subunit family amidase
VAGDPTALPWWTPREGAFPDRILATPRLVAHEEPVADQVAAAFERAVAGLEELLGLPVERIEPPFTTQIDDDWFTTVAVEELTWVGRDVAERRADELTAYVRTGLGIAAGISLDEYLAARRRRFDHTRTMDELLGTDTVLICPTMCIDGFPADGILPGEEAPGTDSLHYNNQPANVTGHPSLSVPAGTHADGTPFGLQITGPRFADELVLALGEAWEAAFPWPLAAPGYEPFAPPA